MLIFPISPNDWAQFDESKPVCRTWRFPITDEVWMRYIKNQVPPKPDDNFKVT